MPSYLKYDVTLTQIMNFDLNFVIGCITFNKTIYNGGSAFKIGTIRNHEES